MSIRTRLEDARILSGNGRQEGAFISVLIAAAATSRKRYGNAEWNDGEAFKNFIYDEMGIITDGAKYEVRVPFCGASTPLEDIFYHHLRCQLVHEGSMPETIVFTPTIENDGESLHTVDLGDPLGIPAGWVQSLATAVWLAPENDSLWSDEAEKRQIAQERYGELRHDGLYCRRPNARRRS